MAESVVVREDGRRYALPALSLGALLVAMVLSTQGLSAILPGRLWWQALADPGNDVQMLIFTGSALPRIAICWIAGAALALAGVLLQSALRNPLADTTTLGTASGAYLALAACAVYAPALLDNGQEWVALAGAGSASAVVIAIARRAGFAPVTVILAGLALNLLCGALGATLAILNHETLSTLFVWQSGSLVQNGWGSAVALLPRLGLAALAVIVISRPLSVLEIGDEQARAVGVSTGLIRLLAVVLAVVLGAATVSAVGVIGFVGLAAGNLARILGARSLRQRLIWAPVLGALLLWLTDQIVQQAGLFRGELPTGSAAALLGAPLLLWILSRRRDVGSVALPRSEAPAFRARRPILILLGLLVALCGCCVLALVFGKGADGWSLLTSASAPGVLPWRWPRVAAAAGAGASLAIAGTMMQRMTGNAMASPEMLGVSSGAALGILALMFALPGFDRTSMMLAAFTGAAATLAVVVALNWRSHFSPERLLLGGVALVTLFSAAAAVLLTSGDPRTAVLLAWMSGSTYRVSEGDAIGAVILAMVALGMAPFTTRWLEILPLGGTARSLGVGVVRSRLVLLMVTAAATASATLIIGPLSFVGLMAPHMARSLGIQRALPQLLAAAALGACLLVAADWLGRNVLFPWQVPAGLVCALLGGPFFLLLMWKRR